jgi:hypothetical protein
MTTFSDEYLNSLNDRLAASAEEVCARLLPGGKRKGREWVCGGVDGGPGKSLGVQLDGDKAGVWHDRATGESGRLLNLWKLNMECSFSDAVAQAADFLGATVETKEREDRPISLDNYQFDPPPPPKITTPKRKPVVDDGPPSAPPPTEFNWQSCVAAFTNGHAKQLAAWRGFSIEFIDYLRDLGLIGIFRNTFAFPVCDKDGKVARCHYRLEKGWAYYPSTGESSPLIIGSPAHASQTIIGESQWDVFAILDKLGHHEDPVNLAGVVTRGANSNTDFSAITVPHMLVVPQNDPAEKASKSTGRTPAQEWLHKIQTSRPPNVDFAVSTVPPEFKDANDWIREKEPTREEVFERFVVRAKNPALDGISSSHEILATETEDDLDSLIGHERRFLGKGGSWVIIGPSGIGKSTLVSSIAIHAAGGQDWHGIKFRRPLRVLVVQAENDRGDIKEMLEGAIRAAGFSPERTREALGNLLWRRECAKTGEDFCRSLEAAICATRADVVVIDPLLSYIGDDISQQKVASTFLRNWLQPILERTGCIAWLVHHTGKPPKDKSALSGWSESDFSYLGLGSSDMVNWARAVSVFTAAGVDTGKFAFRITKRGSRAGMKNHFTSEATTTITLEHSKSGLGWVQCEPPEALPAKGGQTAKITVDNIVAALGTLGMATRRDVLVAQLEEKHKASNRTVREKLESALSLGRCHVSHTEKRQGGGHPVDFIALGPDPSIGGDQLEEPKINNPRQLPSDR